VMSAGFIGNDSSAAFLLRVIPRLVRLVCLIDRLCGGIPKNLHLLIDSNMISPVLIILSKTPRAHPFWALIQ
jgi:hypothetical protein